MSVSERVCGRDELAPGTSRCFEVGGVKVLGPLNIASTVPFHASQMFSRNVVTLLNHIVKNGVLAIDLADEITGAMALAPTAAAITAQGAS